ncbi:unnamed protein product, partial [Linum tenue]
MILDLISLPNRGGLGEKVINSDVSGDGCGGCPVIPCHHDASDPHGTKERDHTLSLWLHGIGHCKSSSHLPINGDQHTRSSQLFVFEDVFLHLWPQCDLRCPHKPSVPN